MDAHSERAYGLRYNFPNDCSCMLSSLECGGGRVSPCLLRGLRLVRGASAEPLRQRPAAGKAPAAPAASPAGELKIVEPAEGSSSGHIDLFSWTAVPGADGYRMHLAAATDNRTVWDSPLLTTTEAHLPNTVALEPEAYVWQITALKGNEVVATSPLSRFTVTP